MLGSRGIEIFNGGGVGAVSDCTPEFEGDFNCSPTRNFSSCVGGGGGGVCEGATCNQEPGAELVTQYGGGVCDCSQDPEAQLQSLPPPMESDVGPQRQT